MPSISFSSMLLDKGGKEINCRRYQLDTQEIDEETIKELSVVHGQTVTITVTY